MFTGREDAGVQLAEYIQEQDDVVPDVVVAVPRGGMPIGRKVADAFDVPLDIVAAKKLTAPDHSDLSIGAISAAGHGWSNKGMIEEMDISTSYLDREEEAAQSLAEEKQETYREIKSGVELEGKHVLVVDDGIATGATMRACVLDVREKGAERISVGVPVSDPRGMEMVGELVEGVFSVLSPGDFEAVSRYYDDFHQLDDQEAMSYLVF